MDNKYGYEKMCELHARYETGEIDLPTFIDEFERICSNNIASMNVRYFSDGYREASVSTLLKIFLKAQSGDKKAQSRLEVDLELVDVNFRVVPMK